MQKYFRSGSARRYRSERSGGRNDHRDDCGRQRSSGRRARRRKNASGAFARKSIFVAVLAYTVYARSDARRRYGYQHHHERRAGKFRVRISAGPDFQQHYSCRRNQPCHAENAVRASRSDAGTHRYGNGRIAQTQRAVLRACHAEPDRTGRYVSAARSADGPLYV